MYNDRIVFDLAKAGADKAFKTIEENSNLVDHPYEQMIVLLGSMIVLINDIANFLQYGELDDFTKKAFIKSFKRAGVIVAEVEANLNKKAT